MQELTVHKAQKPGLATFLARMQQVEEEAAPAICPGKLRLRLSIKRAIKGFAR